MERASQILKNQLNDYVYMDMAEEKYGKLIDNDGDFIPLDSNPDLFTYEDNLTDEEREHNSKVFLYSISMMEVKVFNLKAKHNGLQHKTGSN